MGLVALHLSLASGFCRLIGAGVGQDRLVDRLVVVGVELDLRLALVFC